MRIPFDQAPEGAEYLRMLKVVLMALNPEVARIARAHLAYGVEDDNVYYTNAIEVAESVPPTAAVELRSSMLPQLFEYALKLQMLPMSEIEPSEHDPQSAIEPRATKDVVGLRVLVESTNVDEFDREPYLPITDPGSFFVDGVTIDEDGVLWYKNGLILGHLSPPVVDKDKPPFFKALDSEDCDTIMSDGVSTYDYQRVSDPATGVERDESRAEFLTRRALFELVSHLGVSALQNDAVQLLIGNVTKWEDLVFSPTGITRDCVLTPEQQLSRDGYAAQRNEYDRQLSAARANAIQMFAVAKSAVDLPDLIRAHSSLVSGAAPTVSPVDLPSGLVYLLSDGAGGPSSGFAFGHWVAVYATFKQVSTQQEPLDNLSLSLLKFPKQFILHELQHLSACALHVHNNLIACKTWPRLTFPEMQGVQHGLASGVAEACDDGKNADPNGNFNAETLIASLQSAGFVMQVGAWKGETSAELKIAGNFVVHANSHFMLLRFDFAVTKKVRYLFLT